MPLETRLNAVHGINRYLYEKGKTAGVFLNEAVYGGRSAFAPVDQLATFQKFGQPYVVYNWAMPRIDTEWYVQAEQIAYLVYSTKLEEIRKICNFIVDSMKQYERSATNVQAWLESLNQEQWGGRNYNPYTMLEIYNINVDNVTGPSPIEEAGGLMEALVSLNVTYGLVSNVYPIPDEQGPSITVKYAGS